MIVTGALAVVAWGALAFGAVYPWAYWPLFTAAAAVGIAGIAGRRSQSTNGNTSVALALLVIGGAIAFQLLPLPRAVIAFVSPGTHALLGGYDLVYAGGGSNWHAVSMDSQATRIGFWGYVAFALLTVGLARALSRASVVTLAFGIAVLGLSLAVFGVVQKSTGTLLIYGFWKPLHHPFHIYGPFVNHNHYAGWMLMAIPLALGLTFGGIASAARLTRSDWRSRVLWFASPDGNGVAWAAICVLAMSVATLLTTSRSGIAVVLVIVLIFTALLMRRGDGGQWSTRALAVSIVVMLTLGVFAWAGVAQIQERFATGQSVTGRWPGWLGAIRVAQNVPVFGSGLNTYKAANVYYTPRKLDDPYWDAAHNDYLQLASDGGLLLVIPIVIAIGLVAREFRRRLREDHDRRVYWIRIGAAIGLIGIGLQETVHFSLQLPGIAALFAVLCAIVIHAPRPAARRPRPTLA